MTSFHRSPGASGFSRTALRQTRAWERSGCLRELRPNAVGIPPLDVDEGAGVKDQAVVEVAPGLAPGPFQHLVALPECFLIKEFHESFEGGREEGGTGTHMHGPW